MRILHFNKKTDHRSIEKLIRREALVELKGAGSRSALTRKVFRRDLTPEQAVERIVEDVKKKGDTALFKYCRAFDGFSANSRNLKVAHAEIKAALKAISPSLMKALQITIKNVKAFHLREKPKDWFYGGKEAMVGQRWIPLDRVGLYVPGGLAAYPSSVIMNVVPAKVAGVKETIVVTPVKKDGKVPP